MTAAVPLVMERHFTRLLALAAGFMVAVLLLETSDITRQLTLSAATAAFVWFFCRRTGIALPPVVCCIAVATLGEIVLSIGWGLYSYQHALIPLYVPPGHGLFYALAAATARQPLVRRHERAIRSGVLIAGTIIALISLTFRGDTWGLLWWGGAAALLATSRNHRMLSACFAYTLLLEWAGTANGNWRWAAEVPFVGLTSANPPAGVGILYILLDLIVVAVVTWLTGRGLPVTSPAAPADEPQPVAAG